jgi:hypothetical protein
MEAANGLSCVFCLAVWGQPDLNLKSLVTTTNKGVSAQKTHLLLGKTRQVVRKKSDAFAESPCTLHKWSPTTQTTFLVLFGAASFVWGPELLHLLLPPSTWGSSVPLRAWNEKPGRLGAGADDCRAQMASYRCNLYIWEARAVRRQLLTQMNQARVFKKGESAGQKGRAVLHYAFVQDYVDS